MTADINANGHQVVALSVPDANGEAIRQTAKITEALLESATDLKHAAVTVSAPIALSGQALSLINNAVSPGTISAFDIGVLSAVSDLVIPTSKAVATAIGVHAALITGVHGLVITAGKTLTLTEALTLNALPIGGLAVATAANVLGSLAVGVAGQYLAGGGAGTVPTWATLNQAAVAGLKTTDAPVFGGINLGAGTLTTTEAGIVETNLTRAGLVMKNLYTGAGWARTLLNYTDDDGVVYFGMGAFGTGQAFGYLWIGPAYNNTWLKLDLDGSVAVPYGLHVGGTSPAGDNNLLVDGTAEVTGQTNLGVVHATTLLIDHIGEHTGAHTVVLDNALTSLSIIPAADSTSDLGASTPKYFANAYIDKVYLNSTAALDGVLAGRVGVTGGLSVTGLLVTAQGAPDVETTGAVTVHIADMLTTIVSGAPSAARAYTLDTGSNCDAGMTIAAGQGFEWTLINLATTNTFIITLTASAGHTIVGNPLIAAQVSTINSSAQFFTRKTAANTFITYRIA
jgi:hypothetical protein